MNFSDRKTLVRSLTDRQREVIHTRNYQQDDGVLRIVAGETKSISQPSKNTLRAVLSSETTDRYDDIIRASSFNTPRNFANYFDKNAVLLWAHNRDSSVPTRPIGKIANPDFNGTDMNNKRAFEGDVIFDNGYEFAMEVWNSYESGFLNAFSVGFRPITIKADSEECKGYEFLEVDLLENSAVPIPANPAAVRKAFLDGRVSEKFLADHFFKIKDEILVRNSDIFLPTSWKFRESVNELAILAADIKSGSFKPYETAKPTGPAKETYHCDACDKDSQVVMNDFPEKDYQGVKYRDVTCEHCQATVEEVLAATEVLLSMNS